MPFLAWLFAKTSAVMKFSDFLVAMLVMQHLQFAPLSWQMMQRYHSSKKAVSKKAQKGAVQKSA